MNEFTHTQRVNTVVLDGPMWLVAAEGLVLLVSLRFLSLFCFDCLAESVTGCVSVRLVK